MAAAPYCGSAFRARSWIGSCGLQKSAIVSASSFPCRSEAKICWSSTRVKNALNAPSRAEAGQRGLADVRGVEQVVRAGQVEHVHDAQQVEQGVGQEVQRSPASRRSSHARTSRGRRSRRAPG